MKLLKPLFVLFSLFISLLLFYGAISFVLSLFPKEYLTLEPKDKTLYIYYNSMHSDIILDLKTTKLNWQKYFPEVIQGRSSGYISFGWGDQETYLNTPEWKDIKISTAIKALFTNTPSLIHISYYTSIGKNNPDIKELKITSKQLHTLESSLMHSFGKKPHYISMGYGKNDAFYHSNMTYNLINTCNTWIGDRLREANITMSYWTPFSYNVINSLKE